MEHSRSFRFSFKKCSTIFRHSFFQRGEPFTMLTVLLRVSISKTLYAQSYNLPSNLISSKIICQPLLICTTDIHIVLTFLISVAAINLKKKLVF